MDRRAQAKANIQELSAMISSELDTQRGFKTAAENRAVAVFALNLGIATLYLALRQQFALNTLYSSDPRFWLVSGGLVASGLSLACAVVAVWPGFYWRFTPDDLRAIYRNSYRSDTDLLPNLIEKRIDQLEKLERAVRRKNVWMIVSLALAGLSIGLLGFGIVAQLIWP